MEGEYLSLDTEKKIETVKKAKAILPEGVEVVVISKDDYDRLSGELTKENIELKLEIERLNNIINKAIEILDIYGTSNYEIADLLYSTLRGSDKE